MKFKKLVIFIIIFICLCSSLVLWSRYISTSGLIIKEYKIESADLPQSFNGMKLVHFSDLHYGRTVSEKELKNLINKINYLKPDIVVFTGDLVDKDTSTTSDIKNILVKYLSMIDVTIDKYAIVGNHDYYNDYYVSIMEESGFILLNNNYDIVYNGDYKPIFIGGIGNYTNKKSDVSATMSYFNDINSDLYKIILIHEPDAADEFINYDVDLILAGHSHNGQIALPFVGALFTPPNAKKYYAPYYRINNTDLYISSGIGTSSINFRFCNKPSINFYRFVKIKGTN